MFRYVRTLVVCVCVCALALQVAVAEGAQTGEKYPSRPVDMLVPSGPGGGADQIARVMSPLLEKYLKVPFPVSNLHGAGGNAALSKLISGRPDGYSVSVFMGRIVCSWATIGLGDFKIEDFVWLSRLIKQESAFFVKYDSPIKDAKDLIRIAKEKPIKVAIHGHGNL